MKKALTCMSATLLLASMLGAPSYAANKTSATESPKSAHSIRPADSGYCDYCNGVGLMYPKKDYKRSDFEGSTIQYNGATYRFSQIRDDLSTDTHWFVEFIKV
ncbi:hypothetical protein [Brevibacillus borstelensis]|uniref:hypothetical protein n=1 Tax=Brevibacillus borstelensis TaxID=45462 RepID=UPI0030C580DC